MTQMGDEVKIVRVRSEDDAKCLGKVGTVISVRQYNLKKGGFYEAFVVKLPKRVVIAREVTTDL